jgi:hypothetical protein
MFEEIVEKQTIVVGFVYEIEERGWVKGIAISTGDDDYFVETNEVGEKLRNEVENDIEATGTVTIDPNGKKRILVTEYKLLYKDGEYDLISDLDVNEDF